MLQTGQKRKEFLTGLVLTSFLIGALWGIYEWFTEGGPPFLSMLSKLGIPLGSPRQSSLLQLKTGSRFVVKSRQTILGVTVWRISNQDHPMEYFVLDQAPTPLINSVYNRPVNLAWANMVANQLTRLWQTPDENADAADGSKNSVTIQSIRTLDAKTLFYGKQRLAYWEFEMSYHLNQESANRTFRVGVIRPASGSGRNQPVVISYALTETYQPEQAFSLLGQLSALQ